MGSMSSDPPPDRLVSDSEREPVLEILRQGFTDGRLSQDEFDQRLGMALTARTHAQLGPTLAGLPGPTQAPAPLAGAPAATAGQPAAVTAHLLGIGTSFVGPLVMVLITNNDRSAFARAQAVEALNFQLSLFLITIVTMGMGFMLWPIASVFCIIAAVDAGRGRPYRYPFSLRLVR